jgi:hypothetical protein
MTKYLIDTPLGPCPMEPAVAELCRVLDARFGVDAYTLETVSGVTGEDGLPYLAGEGVVGSEKFRETVRLYPKEPAQ